MFIFEGKWNRRIPHIHPLSFSPRCHRPPTTTPLASSFLPKATPPLRWSRKQPRMDDSSSSSSSSSRWVGEKEEGKLCQECAIRLSLVPAAEMGERERARGREGGRLERELCLYSEEEGRVKEMRGERENGFFSLFPFPVSAAQNSLIWPRRAGWKAFFQCCFTCIPVKNVFPFFYSPYIFPSSLSMIFLLPQGGYMASASWKLCSISGAQTPSASVPDTSLSSSNSEESNLVIYQNN